MILDKFWLRLSECVRKKGRTYENLIFRLLKWLRFNRVTLRSHNGHEEDPAAGKEFCASEGLEEWVVASFFGVGVEVELRSFVCYVLCLVLRLAIDTYENKTAGLF